MNMDQSKNSQQNISQSDPAIYKKDNSSQPTWWGGRQLSWEYKAFLMFKKSISEIYDTNRLKRKTHMIISI